jgi:peroxiredoxin (alkyl hydroperoxide reductase subunit C)
VQALQARDVAVLGISGDSPPCHAEFVKARGVGFPQLSDLHRVVISAYGVLDEERNVAYRSTFVVDRDGVLRWGQAGDRHMIRDGREMFRVLDIIGGLRRPS